MPRLGPAQQASPQLFKIHNLIFLAYQGTVKTINARAAMIETTKQFWDNQFEQKERVFNDDWIMTPETSCELCARELAPGSSVLVAGCGMSNLPFLLNDLGFLVTAVDISEGGLSAIVLDPVRLP